MYSNFDSKNTFSFNEINQPFPPSIKFINDDKFELINHSIINTKKCLIFLGIFFIIYIIGLFVVAFIENSTYWWIMYIFGFLFFFSNYLLILYFAPLNIYVEFDKNDLELKETQILLFFKPKIIRYDLYKIESFKYNPAKDINNYYYIKIKLFDKDKEITLFGLRGNYLEINKLKNFLNEKLQKITKRNYSNNLIYEI